MARATVQFPVAANATAKPEVALALTAKSGAPNVLVARGPNVIVWLALTMEKPCEIVGADLKLPFPACDAVTVHEPAPVMRSVAPLTVQLPVAANATGKPEVAVATRATSVSPNVLFASAAKVIVWLTGPPPPPPPPAGAAETDSVSCGAALMFASPGWSNTTVQVPVPLVIVNVAPVFVHAPLLEKVTAPPGAVAATVKFVLATALAGAACVTVIACVALAMENVLATSRAAPNTALPGSEAVIVQLPAPVRCEVVPTTEHVPVAAKLTGRPELAV